REERFAELVAYKTQHGDCHVPRGYPENPALGSWVMTQRTAKRAETLSEERIARLDALGCVWDPRKRTR
ncbi:MAG: helicase, partial [Acidimicrobiia bacterium]|nr:helicase [Acidimicrobiia bacterium]